MRVEWKWKGSTNFLVSLSLSSLVSAKHTHSAWKTAEQFRRNFYHLSLTLSFSLIVIITKDEKFSSFQLSFRKLLFCRFPWKHYDLLLLLFASWSGWCFRVTRKLSFFFVKIFYKKRKFMVIWKWNFSLFTSSLLLIQSTNILHLNIKMGSQ